MKSEIIRLFQEYPQYALLLSIAISIVVAVLGVIPSFFITAANILFFGFWNGLAVSFLGEAVGAVIAFVLYRRGFKKVSQPAFQKYPTARRLVEVEGRNAFYLILSLRFIPFVPSGLVTFAAAVGKVSLPVFAVASSVGKIPALLMEAYSVYQVARFQWQGKLILFLVAAYLLYLVFRKRR